MATRPPYSRSLPKPLPSSPMLNGLNSLNFGREKSEMARNLSKQNTAQRSLFACVEGGGQSWLVLVSEGVDPPKEIDSCRFETTEMKDGKLVSREAGDVIQDCVSWLKVFESRHGKVTSIGIVSFGPVDLNHHSHTFGYITTTPKKGWQGTDVVGPFARAFKGTPIGFDTDVNMVAVSEYKYGGHAEGISSSAYITVGTGIGVGMCTNGKAIHGLVHPEGGHIRVPRYKAPEGLKADWLDENGYDNYSGNCQFHCKDAKGNSKLYPCVEGMANSDAIADRLGILKKKLKDVPDEDPVWDLVAYYLAQLCASITFLSSPEVIVIGGGVMNREVLYPKIRHHFKYLLGEYFVHKEYNVNIDKYIARSKFDKVEGHVHAGVMGGLELARRVWELSDKFAIQKQSMQIAQLQQALIAKDAESHTLHKFVPQPQSFGFSPVGMLTLGLGAGCGAALTIGLMLRAFRPSSN